MNEYLYDAYRLKALACIGVEGWRKAAVRHTTMGPPLVLSYKALDFEMIV